MEFISEILSFIISHVNNFLNWLPVKRLNLFYIVIFFLSIVVLIRAKRPNNYRFAFWALSYSLLGILSMIVSHILLDITFVVLFLTLVIYGASMLKKSDSKKCLCEAIYTLVVAIVHLLWRLWVLVLLFLPQTFEMPNIIVKGLDIAMVVLLVYDCVHKVEILRENNSTKTQ